MNCSVWAGPALFVLAALGALVYLRGRSRATPAGEGLTDAEQTRLDELLSNNPD